MPSLFPGMDPYLEHPRLWPDVHNAFLYNLRVAINRQLPEGFSVRAEERLVSTREVFIEIHTHSDKSAGRGRGEYLSKQKALLASDIHLLELDLLRAGEHTLAASTGAAMGGVSRRWVGRFNKSSLPFLSPLMKPTPIWR